MPGPSSPSLPISHAYIDFFQQPQASTPDSKKRLALAIIDFLSSSLKDGTLTAEDNDNVEIAQNCIAEAFHVDPANEAAMKDAIGGQSLLSIYGVYEKLKSKAGTMPSTTRSTAADGARPAADGADANNKKAEAESYKSKGNAYMSAKDYPAAIESYTTALNLSPQNPIYLSNRAAAYSASNQHALAAADAELATETDPTYTKAWSRLGLARFAMGDAKGSMEAYTKGIEAEGKGGSEAMKKGYATAKAKVDAEGGGVGAADIAADDIPSDPISRGASPSAGAAPGGGGGGGMPDFASLANMLGGGGAGRGGGGAGAGAGMPDLSSMMNNPMFANMAQNLMSNPDMMNNIMNNPQLRN